MNRRQFLAGAGCAGLHAFSARGDNGPTSLICPPFLKNPIAATPKSSRPIQLPPACAKPLPRPLWSTLSYPRKVLLAKKLRYAWSQMARRKDCSGWLCQAWLHAWYCGAGVSSGLTIHDDPVFLLWHRAFLYAHELLLQSCLHDPDFRLPVWDWENNENVPWLYQPFPSIPGVSCPTPRRESIVPVKDADLESWLKPGLEFIGYPGNAGTSAGFVHQQVHAQLSGYMGCPETSAVDPVFYAHHANVDRYWCYWSAQSGNADPWPKSILPQENFCFYDARGQSVYVDTAILFDTTNLGYCYEMPTRPVLRPSEPLPAKVSGNAVTVTQNLWSQILGYLDTQFSLSDLPSLQSAWNVSEDLFRRLANIPYFALICDVKAEVSGIRTGQYYSIEIQSNAANPGIVVGGFGDFMSGHHHDAHPIRPTVCLELDAIAQIARSFASAAAPAFLSDLFNLARTFQLVYGPANPDPHARRSGRPPILGKPTPLTLTNFAIRIPTGS